MRHPLDPRTAHETAACLGRLSAAGLVDDAEIRAALGHAVRRATGVDPSGLAARLAHALADARDDWARRRRAAGWRIRVRLAPLVAAGAAVAAGDGSLLPGEARALAAALVAERLWRTGWGRLG